jgi:hypothetical protein
MMTGVERMTNSVVFSIFPEDETALAEVVIEHLTPVTLSRVTQGELSALIRNLLKDKELDPRSIRKVVWGYGDTYATCHSKDGSFFGVYVPKDYRERLRDQAILIRLVKAEV